MDTTTLSHGDLPAKTTSRSNPARYLYAGVSALLFVLTFLGFQQFYMHGNAVTGRPLFPLVKTLIIVHGVAMTGWMVLFLVQPLLIVGHKRRLHMSLGIVGAGLAACIVVLGIWSAIATTRVEPDFLRFGLNRKQFMLVQLMHLLPFGLCVLIGVWNRRRAEIHRPMMLLATLAVVPAALDRITGLPDLWAPTVFGHLFGPFFPPLVIGITFLLLKTALTRTFDRWLTGGLVAFAMIGVFMMKIAPTAAWENVARFLTG
jgi:hypothetical protein